MPSDFLQERTDKNVTRQQLNASSSLLRKFLKKDSVPTVWPNCPVYLSQNVPPPRNNTAHSDHRRQVEQEIVEEEARCFLELDNVNSVAEVEALLKQSQLPSGVHFVRQDGKIILFAFDISPASRASVLFSLTILPDLSFAMHVREIKIKHSAISHITTNETFQTCSEILNVVAFLKSKETFTSEEHRESAIQSLEKCIESSEDQNSKQQMEFIVEQLQLMTLTKTRRRFSSSLLAMSTIWLQTSPALYRQIVEEDIIINKYFKSFDNLACISF